MMRSYENLKYMDGFGNHNSTEALPDTLPKGTLITLISGQNSPQKVSYGLLTEQLSGSAFTAPRHQNFRSWLYRIRPSAAHLPFKQITDQSYGKYVKNDFLNDKDITVTPNQLRWGLLAVPKQQTNFVQGLVSVAGAGDPSLKTGLAIYVYSANTSMTNVSFFSSDGDFLIVPWDGQLYITTEFGQLTVKPREIIVIPRGVKFSVECTTQIRGYIVEIFKGHFKLPDLGPIGSNGLANPRDFQTPVAYFENTQTTFQIINKFAGKFFTAEKKGSPYDIVAWHGNYSPYKYNLDLFNAMNTVTFDHPDPSIFTVLTCQSDEPGVAICDFVIFPPRWVVAEHTFRPPYYHRNIMSEYMGNISGVYDAKESGFKPGYSILHSVMEGHGPDSEGFEKFSNAELIPTRYPYENLSFMFESTYMYKVCSFVMDDQLQVDHEYYNCWQKLAEHQLGDQK